MKTKRHELYVHQKTGEVIGATKSGAKKLSDDYKKVEFVTNDQGKQVARVKIEGATIDISERETKEVAGNVNTSTN